MAEFTPVTKASMNVKDDLLLAASDRKLRLEEIDFDLLSYTTYCKKSESNDWSPISGGNFVSQISEEEICSCEFLLKQEYEIKIRPYVPHQYLDLRFNVGMSKAKGIITALIDPASTIPLKKGVQEWIKDAINRKKLRLGFMIGMSDEHLDKEIHRLLATIQKNGPITAPFPLVIGSFCPAVDVVHDAAILRYKKLDEEREEESYIQGVKPGDLVLEYIFPKKGRNGRGLDGAPIVVPEPIVKYAGAIVVDPATITTQQDENSIRYHATTSGFIKRDKGVFKVANDLHLESVSMKTTGSILAGTDKEISLKVEQRDCGEDAVGIGVNIDIQTVDISGTVGENTKIKACDLNIGAQTHKKSTMEVTGIANIKLHRGNLKAKEANIDVLEGGIIEGDIVRVKKMLGGEIIAREVFIEVLYSHSKIIALESIEIGSIEGEGNTIAIDPDSVGVYHERISVLVDGIKEKEELLQGTKKELGMKQVVFKDKTAQAKRIQQRIVDAKQNRRDPLETDIITIQQYRAEAGRIQAHTVKVAEDENALLLLREGLNTLYEADLNGIVTHHGVYLGNSRVVYVDPKTRQEYATFPKGKATHIRLQKKEREKVLVVN